MSGGFLACDPNRIRTGVAAVRGRSTRPLYDGAVFISEALLLKSNRYKHIGKVGFGANLGAMLCITLKLKLGSGTFSEWWI